MKATIYDKSGKEAGSTDLPDAVFAVRWNPDLVHEVVTSMQSNARQNIAYAKDRSDVRGGGKKPWRQKGTGRARHGSRRSPIWVGGGVTHGPTKDRSYDKKINRKARAVALMSALSRKLKDNQVLFVKDYLLDAPKTAEAKSLLKSLEKHTENFGNKTKNAVCVVLPGISNETAKSFANVPEANVVIADSLNPVDVLSSKYLLIINPDESVKIIASRVSKIKEKNTVKKAPAKKEEKAKDVKKPKAKATPKAKKATKKTAKA